MRFVVFVKANQESEAGVMPTEEQLAEMGKFNEELVKAGAMLAGEGLQPSSKDEVIEWIKRAPFREGEVEIRQIFEPEDFGAEFTPELREQEERLRRQI